MRKEGDLIIYQLANLSEDWAYDGLDAGYVYELAFSILIGDDYEFDPPLELWKIYCAPLGLFVGWDKSHVSGWDLDEGYHVDMASYCLGVPSCPPTSGGSLSPEMG